MTMKICSAEGCEKKAVVRGYCKAHYSKLVRAGELDVRPPCPQLCEIPDCGRVYYAKGLCQQHYLDHWHTQRFLKMTGQVPNTPETAE